MSLTNGFIPQYDTSIPGFRDSIVWTDGTKIGINTPTPLVTQQINGDLYVKSTGDGILCPGWMSENTAITVRCNSAFVSKRSAPNIFSSTLYIEHESDDLTAYTQSTPVAQGNGLTIESRGKPGGTDFLPQYLDIHGLITRAEIHTHSSRPEKGCSGIVAASVQYGSGVATNEFYVYNYGVPGVQKASHLCAVLGSVSANNGDYDPAIGAYNVFEAKNDGSGKIRSAYTAYGPSAFCSGIDLSGIHCTQYGINLGSMAIDSGIAISLGNQQCIDFCSQRPNRYIMEGYNPANDDNGYLLWLIGGVLTFVGSKTGTQLMVNGALRTLSTYVSGGITYITA